MNSKRKLLISMLAIVFVLLAVVATVAIAFALTQQTITTTLNIGYVVEDIDGTASATYTIGGVTESLTAKKGNQVIGDTLVFHAGDTEDAGNLMFPEGQIPLSAQNDNIVIQYTYSNTGAKHYIASMSFDGNISADNMKVEYSIDGTTYSENRYAVVVPAHSTNKSYWIKISIENKAKSASFTGDFNWLLSGCDEQADSYKSLTSVEMQSTGTAGRYKVSITNSGSYVGELVFPSLVNGDPVTTIVANDSLTQEQKNQVTSVYIPDSVESIGTAAFNSFRNLQTVTFEQNETSGASVQSGTGLQTIGDMVFSFSGLREIIIPNTVNSMTGYAFDCCDKLISIKVAAGSTKYKAVNNCLINTNDKVLTRGCKTSIIPADGSVEIIGVYAFSGCSSLTKINIPEPINVIGALAFAGCGLTEIELPSTITGVGDIPFTACGNLKNITINSTIADVVNLVTNIAANNGDVNLTIENVAEMNYGFAYCEGIKSVIIGDGVTTIGSEAFRGCTDLTSVKIGKDVTTISCAFYGCGVRSIWVPKTVTTVVDWGPPAFSDMVVFCEAASKPEGWELDLSYDYGAIFEFGVSYEDYQKSVTETAKLKQQYPEFEIVYTNNGGYLTKYLGTSTNVVIPDCVTALGRAFENNTTVTSVTIPNGVTSIGGFAFNFCAGLTSIIIPNSITSIGGYTFQGCTGLTSVTFENKTGWKAGATAITESQLSDPTTAATLLKDTYRFSTWSRS